MAILSTFLKNIFDIDIDQDFTNLFVANDELDIGKVLKHHLLFVNMIYYEGWKYCFGTFPTKKDFTKFVHDHKISIIGEEFINIKLLEKVVNSFSCLKIGFIKDIDVQSLCAYVDKEIMHKKENVQSMISFLHEKWKYHYNCFDIELDTKDNLFSSFMKVYKTYKSNKPKKFLTDVQTNPVTGSINEIMSFSESEINNLTEYEKAQFVLYSDINMFIRCLDNCIIVIDTSFILAESERHVLNEIISVISAQYNKTPIVLNVGTSPITNFDYYYSFHIMPEYFYIFPKVLKACMYVSSNRFPINKSLCKKKEHSLYYVYGNIHNNKEDQRVTDSYDRFLVTHVGDFKAYYDISKHCADKKNLFLLPKFYNDEGKNPVSFVHKRFLIDMDSYVEYKNIIDTFSIRTGINCSVVRPGYFVADFIIDLHRRIDPKLYCYNGVIPILSYHYECIHSLVNGMYAQNIKDALDFIETLYNSLHVVKQFKINAKNLQIIYNTGYFRTVLKDHLTHVCPYSTVANKASPLFLKNNVLLLHNFLYAYFDACIEKIASIKVDKSSEYKVILIDNRENPLSIIGMYFTLCNLKKEFWGVTVYTSKKATDFYMKHLGDYAEIVEMDVLNIPKFHIDVYNDICKDSTFWKEMKAKKCLIIQDDGFIVREGVEHFLQYDYVGAPWADSPGNIYLKENISHDMVGNGGLSIRDTKVMTDICDRYQKEKRILFCNNMTYIPEDVYVCMCMKKLSNEHVASKAEAMKFSSEQICNIESIGMHKPWVYHNVDIVAHFFDSILRSVIKPCGVS